MSATAATTYPLVRLGSAFYHKHRPAPKVTMAGEDDCGCSAGKIRHPADKGDGRRLAQSAENRPSRSEHLSVTLGDVSAGARSRRAGAPAVSPADLLDCGMRMPAHGVRARPSSPSTLVIARALRLRAQTDTRRRQRCQRARSPVGLDVRHWAATKWGP